MHKKPGSFINLVLTIALFVMAIGAAQATQQADIPEATYTTHDDGFEGPEELPAGFVNITLQNEGEGGYTLVFLRLKEDATVEEVVSAVEEVDRVFAEGGDASAALNEVLELADVISEAFVEPGASYSFGTTLEAGSHVVYGTAEPEEGALPVSTHRVVEVAAGETQAEAPQADVTVRMVDFAFAMPPDIGAGEQTWEVINAGEQLHHLVLMRLAEGRTIEDVMAFMGNFEGEPPTEDVGYVGILSPGESMHVTFDLEPATYIAVCFMPDHRGEATGQPHVALGMIQAFTVEE